MISIYKRKISVCILLSILTLGIYQIVWAYLLVKNTRAIKKDTSSCTGEMLCLLFVPFYALYWWYTRGYTITRCFAKRGHSTAGNRIIYLIFGIFGLDIISMAMIQKDFNSLPSVASQAFGNAAHATIELRHLSKSFPTGETTVEALKDINLTIRGGEIYGIIGMSGAGKSTLVRCINLLERPTEGDVLIDGVNMGKLSSSQLRSARRSITMIFQNFNLLMQRTCLDNICFPLELAGVRRSVAKEKARELLATVGLPDKEKAYPAQLSGGQQQRIAIARALATNPKVLLCDEATSALDPKTTHSILELIREINRKLGITVIVITHQMSVVEEICDRVAILDNGTVAEEGDVATVFAAPSTDAAKRLVFPDSADTANLQSAHEDERILRVVFNGADCSATPMIASMAMEEKIAANILYASTRTIGDMVYGNMLLGVKDDDEIVKRATEYLSRNEKIVVMEVKRNV